MDEIDQINGSLVDYYGYNPILAIQADTSEVIPHGSPIFEDALKVLGKYGVQLLIPLLESNNINTVSNALFVFSELSIDKRRSLVKYAIEHIHSEDESAQWYVIDGILAFANELSPEFIAICLEMAGDESERLRMKVIELISAIQKPLLEKSVELTHNEKDEHSRGLKHMFGKNELDTNDLSYENMNNVQLCYVFARIFKLAKSEVFIDLDESDSESWLHFYMRKRLEILKKAHHSRR